MKGEGLKSFAFIVSAVPDVCPMAGRLGTVGIPTLTRPDAAAMLNVSRDCVTQDPVKPGIRL